MKTMLEQHSPLWKRTCLAACAIGLSTATVGRADTFRIEIDYMVDGTDHSHEPSAQVINAVIQMFACQGHTLIIDVDDALTHYEVLKRDPDNCSATLFSYSGSADSYGKIKEDNFDNGSGWHYCIFAHNYQNTSCNTTSSSGLANGSVDFIVSLGSFSGQTGTLFDQAATLAHEFGHNLGLSHCGNEYCGSDTGHSNYAGNYMPNMPSVMSYRYQLGGVKNNMLCTSSCDALMHDEALFKHIDYSHGKMCALDEDALNENLGTQMVSVDWDNDDTLEASVVQNINGDTNGWCGSAGNRTVLNDYDEWANIVDVAAAGMEGIAAKRAQVQSTCITAEEWEEVQLEMQIAGGCGQPALTVESCISGENVYIGNLAGSEDGTCEKPYDNVQQAHDASPNNSVFFLRPRTYNNDPKVFVTLTKPGKYFCESVGSAIIE